LIRSNFCLNIYGKILSVFWGIRVINKKDASFNSCLEKISELSGYEIFVTGESVDYTISIDLKDVTIEKSFTRILKGINHAAEWDDTHRSITLYLYGSHKNDNKTEKFIGLSPLLNIKPVIKNTEPVPDRSTPQISNGYQPESSTQNNRDYPRDRNITLNVSGVKTSFVQETPTGSLGP